ncbi:DUF3599 family protein [Aureibacillus halotolerans]|uniref:Uncharacterized protein DUF3599 n=1 Tax=Aureibacillus halotolerans TaxID=1508390 RepID=A0A4V6PWD6_9BACI|nr:DUF3599 family protein [Aureibacillus halotolerans]TDQ35278.1 uncharacterized protein DUF3599 [Aureibacillus halotolerans]
MSFESLLTHRCDIYHLQNSAAESNYGIPSEHLQQRESYNDTPDASQVPCYFEENSQSMSQGEPGQLLSRTMQLFFLPSADVRENSKVILDGRSYILQVPNKIRGHHIEVEAVRSKNL